MTKGVSVIICTFNGSKRIPQTLAHLAQQSVRPELEWEIILVDNASTDDTIEVARRAWEKLESPQVAFSIIQEPKPGKIHALEAGTNLCKHDYFIICDDDNWLLADYVQTTFDILESDPNIGAVGGHSIAVNDSGLLPGWFKQYEGGYAVGEQGSTRGDVTQRGFLFGAGLGTRTRLYQEIYRDFQSLLVGRQGVTLSAGEDSEYCQRLILKNYTLFYDPKLKFKHYMPDQRLQKSYRDKLFAGLDQSNVILNDYYLINKVRRKLKNSKFNRVRLLLLSPFRIMTARSAAKVNEQVKIIKYLLNIESTHDPIFNKIRKFERKKSH
jgi:glycosyltransferase involved in cell wall biosynthesis